MRTSSKIIRDFTWSGKIDNLEAKRKIALHLADQIRDGDVVGVGSGSTSYVAIQAISERMKRDNLHCLAIPTSHEVAMACASLGIPIASLWEHHPDWCFDGADEVDSNHNLLKGRGGAMFREKLIMRAILAPPAGDPASTFRLARHTRYSVSSKSSMG